MTATEPETSTSIRIIANRTALLDMLSVASKAVATRSPKPILCYVRLSASGDTLSALATDLEMSAKASTSQVQIESAGDICIHAAEFSSVINAIASDTITLAVSEGVATISGEDCVYRLPAHDAKDFPSPLLVEADEVRVSGEKLANSLSAVISAISKEQYQYAFAGALFECAIPNRLAIVGTDGRRMHAVTLDAAHSHKGSCVIPSSAVKVVASLCGDEAEVIARFTENQASFSGSDWSIQTTLVEGTFPPYKDVIPKNSDIVIPLDRESLLSAVQKANVAAGDELETNHVRFAFGKNGLTLSSSDRKGKSGEVNFPCKSTRDITIGFKGDFVIDALKALDSSEVTLSLAAPNRPGLFSAGDTRCVVMPVNISQ